MTLASIVLLGLLGLLLFTDFVTLRRRGRRVVIMEVVVFSVGGVMIAFPDLATHLAGLVGIGRGVDFVIYPAMIWLVRESILNRHMRWEESERMTELVRVLAIQRAQRKSEEPSAELVKARLGLTSDPSKAGGSAT